MSAIPSMITALALFLSLLAGDGWLGVYLSGDEDQPVIEEVVPGSPAAAAGLKRGDLFLAVDDKPCKDTGSFVEAIKARNAGETVKLRIRRGQEEVVVSAKLGSQDDAKKVAAAMPERAPERATAPAVAAGRPYLGLELGEDDDGVRIERVLEGGPAAKHGLKNGEWLRAIGDRRVRTLADVERGMRGLEPGRKIELGIESDGGKRTVALELGRTPGSDVAASPRAETRRPEARSEPAPAQRSEPRTPLAFGSDLAAARKQAAGEKRPLLLVFGASWCASCQALKKAMQDPGVASALERYVRVWIDTDEQGRIADEFDVQGLPHLEVLDAGGRRVAKQIGYQAPEPLKAFLDGHAGAKETARRTAATEKAALAEPAPRRGEMSEKPAKTEKSPASEVEGLRKELEGLRAEVKELRELLRKLNEGRGR